jgi:hypothetical protein
LNNVKKKKYKIINIYWKFKIYILLNLVQRCKTCWGMEKKIYEFQWILIYKYFGWTNEMLKKPKWWYEL